MIIAKQTKQKEKKDMRATKDKGFDKAGDNWKAASEDFRSALKALKKDEKEEKDETEGAEEETKNVKEEPAVKTCQYCEKKFNELFMEKHL